MIGGFSLCDEDASVYAPSVFAMLARPCTTSRLRNGSPATCTAMYALEFDLSLQAMPSETRQPGPAGGVNLKQQ